MKAIDLAKKLYPALSKQDFIEQTCPDILMIIDKKPKCCENERNKYINDNCINCWNQEISQERVDWLIECKKMCNLLGC